VKNALGRVIKLSSNESAIGPSEKALEAYRAEAAKLHRYPDSGHAKLREAIASAYKLDAAHIVCGAGSDELIGLLIHAYAGEGDEILMSRHGFLMYKIYAQGFGAETVMAPEKNLTMDVDAMLAAVTPRTRIVFIANPNNPTGTYIPRAELLRLRKGLPEGVLLAIDGAYSEYVEHADYSDGLELVNDGTNTVVLRTFSKIYGLPALRVGWGYFPAHIADVLNRIRGPFNVNAAALAAGTAAMADSEHMARSLAHNREGLAWLGKELAALGYGVMPSVGNFLLMKCADSAAVNAHLLDASIIVRDVAAYGLPEYLRVTVGTTEENQALITALKAFAA
jgi:histidinol-phosphate aminotransferase